MRYSECSQSTRRGKNIGNSPKTQIKIQLPSQISTCSKLLCFFDFHSLYRTAFIKTKANMTLSTIVVGILSIQDRERRVKQIICTTHHTDANKLGVLMIKHMPASIFDGRELGFTINPGTMNPIRTLCTTTWQPRIASRP